MKRPLRAYAAAACALICLLGRAYAEDAVSSVPSAAALRAEARAYEHGEGVGRDVARAIALYCQAARYGDLESQFSLGWIYANGRGVPRQDALAAYHFTLAAAQGHDQAAHLLRFVGAPQREIPDCLRPDVPPLPAPSASEPTDWNLEVLGPETPMQKLAVRLVGELAPKYGVQPRLALAVIRAESNFDAAARSARNAQGLMQLIPETAARFNIAKPFEPAQNIRGGLAYLRWLLAYFEGDVALVAAAYNAGEGAVNRYRGVPPFAETRVYVQRILQLFGAAAHPYDQGVTEASPELASIRKSSLRLHGAAVPGGATRTASVP